LNQEYQWPDEIDYDAIARRLLRGDGYGNWLLRGPLYSIVLWIIYSFTGIHFLAVRIFQALLDSGTCLMVIYLGRLLFNNKSGLISGLLYSIYPFFIYFTGILLSENLFIFLIVATILFGIKFQQKIEIKNLILFSVSLGLLILCRPIAQIYLFPFCMWVIYLMYRLKLSRSQILLFGLSLLLFSLVTIAPWSYRNYKVHNKFIFISTGGGRMFWYGNGPHATLSGTKPFPEEMNNKLLELNGHEPNNEDYNFSEAKAYMDKNSEIFDNIYINYERSQYLYQEAFQYIFDNPKVFLKNYFKKLILFWSPISISRTINDYNTNYHQLAGSLAYLFILLFFILGIVQKRKDFHKYLLLYIVVLFNMFGVSLFSTSVRYRIPIDPFLILFASSALEALVSKFNWKKIKLGGNR